MLYLGYAAHRQKEVAPYCLKDLVRANAHIFKSGPAKELFCFSHLVFSEKEKRFGITKTDTRIRRKGGSTNSAV
jgi:hypothetical protein